MKTIYKAIFIFSVALFTQNMTAQKGTISGTITDTQSPLPGATILLSNNQKATTDFSGAFSIQDVRSGSFELQISYIGYEVKTIKVEIKDNQKLNLGIIQLSTNSKELNEVVVSGMSQRNSEARALNMQKKSMSIVNVIAADGIGKLPDRNAAETVQRMPGVSIERDQGEGRFVSVRGLPPFGHPLQLTETEFRQRKKKQLREQRHSTFFRQILLLMLKLQKHLRQIWMEMPLAEA